MGKWIRLSVLFIVLLIALVGSSKGHIIGIYEMINFYEEKQGSYKEISEPYDIEVVNLALNNMYANIGAANMPFPHYKIEIDTAQYYIWLFKEHNSVTLVNLNNTSTTLSLSRKYTEQFIDMVLSLY